MDKTRMEAFSDGVIAILITIMVLELRPPEATTWVALRPMLPVFLAYILSFAFLGIYWANHHHLLQLAERVNGGILWANLHLLFWLSMIPFAAAWVGRHYDEAVPTALYGIVLLCAAIAYTLLERALIKEQGPNSPLAAAVGHDVKELATMAFNVGGVLFSFYKPWIGDVLYALIALTWIVPDPRIERHMRGA
ncbi:MAG: TMEM175 family protein [Gemmatimonadaceae bacterium]